MYVYETLAKSLRDSLGCKDCCANTNSLTYLLTGEWYRTASSITVSSIVSTDGIVKAVKAGMVRVWVAGKTV